MKKTIKKIGIGIARRCAKAFLTPELVKRWICEALSGIAAKAHSSEKSQRLVRAVNITTAAMDDGVVNMEETNMLCGDIVTSENIAKVVDFICDRIRS